MLSVQLALLNISLKRADMTFFRIGQMLSYKLKMQIRQSLYKFIGAYNIERYWDLVKRFGWSYR